MCNVKFNQGSPHVAGPSPDTNSNLIYRPPQSVHASDTFRSCFGDDVHQYSAIPADALCVFDSNLCVHPNACWLSGRIVDDVGIPPHRRQVTEPTVSFAGQIRRADLIFKFSVQLRNAVADDRRYFLASDDALTTDVHTQGGNEILRAVPVSEQGLQPSTCTCRIEYVNPIQVQ